MSRKEKRKGMSNSSWKLIFSRKNEQKAEEGKGTKKTEKEDRNGRKHTGQERTKKTFLWGLAWV